MTADASIGAAQSPEGLDLNALAAYLPRYLPAAEGALSAEWVSGGKSNLTYVLRSPRGEWVLRRPPLGHVLPTAHDMAREFRVISALGGTDVPVPATYHLCEDATIIGAPFYVMEHVPGVVVREDLPAGFATSSAERRDMGEALIDTLVRLHAVDYEAVGLGEFGRPQGYLGRQVRRWSEQWERSKTRELAAIDELRRRLERALPESPAPTIVHGDYRLENMILDAENPGRVAAVLDWEMSTLGDPLADLAYAVMYWLEPEDGPIKATVMDRGRATMARGFQRREELIARYEERSGRKLEAIDFYLVFSHFKLAVIVEGIVARYLAGETVGEGFDGYEERPPILAQWALQIADASANPALRGE